MWMALRLYFPLRFLKINWAQGVYQQYITKGESHSQSCLTTCLAARVGNSSEFPAELLMLTRLCEWDHLWRKLIIPKPFEPKFTCSHLLPQAAKYPAVFQLLHCMQRSAGGNHTYALRDFSYEDIQVSTKPTMFLFYLWVLIFERTKV